MLDGTFFMWCVCMCACAVCLCMANLFVLVSNRAEGKVLETVGVFEAPKQHGKYETGQVWISKHSFNREHFGRYNLCICVYEKCFLKHSNPSADNPSQAGDSHFFKPDNDTD